MTENVTGTSGSTGSTGSTGSGPLALTIDSSSYTVLHGMRVTFTVKLTGGSSPTGTINFQDGTASIAGCSAVALNSGTATCSASWSSAGTHSIRGLYSGDASNGPGIAGPITEKVS